MRMRSWAGSVVTSSPKKRTRPRVAGKSRVTTWNGVGLPPPLAPMTARRSPTATENETSSIARRAPKVRVTPSNTRASPETSVDDIAIRTRLGTIRLVARADLELGGRDAQSLVQIVDIIAHLVILFSLRLHLNLIDNGHDYHTKI